MPLPKKSYRPQRNFVCAARKGGVICMFFRRREIVIGYVFVASSGAFLTCVDINTFMAHRGGVYNTRALASPESWLPRVSGGRRRQIPLHCCVGVFDRKRHTWKQGTFCTQTAMSSCCGFQRPKCLRKATCTILLKGLTAVHNTRSMIP